MRTFYVSANGESLLGRVSQQLSSLEKRAWELWMIVSITGILVTLGLCALILPSAFLKNDGVHVEITVSRPLSLGLIVLLALLNTYLIGRRIEVRRLREEVISSMLQKELSEQQSLIDPLTEIYNRRSLYGIVGRLFHHVDEWNNRSQLEDFQLSVSIGAAEWQDGQSFDEVLDMADRRMYDHKEVGGSRQ